MATVTEQCTAWHRAWLDIITIFKIKMSEEVESSKQKWTQTFVKIYLTISYYLSLRDLVVLDQEGMLISGSGSLRRI